jgi:CheY-like chemotaxis protein
MKRILIADSSKASLVMTSEVFKDHYPGIQVLVARTSTDAIAIAKSTSDIDAFIVDYDLPDTNGAQTALLLKKISKVPILITAFDKQDVVENIETLLVKYEDCRSWLKKPVNPEVVIAVAQRYCDGLIRAQKRIPCHLPVFASIHVNDHNSNLSAKNKVTKKKPTLKSEETTKKISKPKKIEQPVSIFFHGIIEDCSLSGIKLKPSKNTTNGTTEWSQFLENIENISAGHTVTLTAPAFLDIEIGKINELSKVQISHLEKESKKTVTKTPKKLSPTTSGAISKKLPLDKTQELSGRIVWTSADSGEWRMGIELEDQALSKRLFEAIISYQARQHKGSQNQSIMKTTRAS